EEGGGGWNKKRQGGAAREAISSAPPQAGGGPRAAPRRPLNRGNSARLSVRRSTQRRAHAGSNVGWHICAIGGRPNPRRRRRQAKVQQAVRWRGVAARFDRGGSPAAFPVTAFPIRWQVTAKAVGHDAASLQRAGGRRIRPSP